MAIIIAVDIGGTQIRAAAFRRGSTTPIEVRRTPTRGEEPAFERMCTLIQSIWPEHEPVEKIVVPTPGPLNPVTGMIYSAPNIPGWENFPISDELERRFGTRAKIGNDANLAALGEWRFGAGRGHDDVLFLTVSTGIGGGVISGGKLLLGAQGLGAELGHILAVPDGPLCGCGQRGHLEAVASGTAIGRLAQARLRAGDGADSKIWELVGGEVEQVTGAMVGEAALLGDAFATRLVTEAGSFLGRTLSSLLSIFNPSIVILGGGVSMLGDILFNPVREAVKRHAMSEAFWRNCPIVPAALGDDAGLIGAGALAMEQAP